MTRARILLADDHAMVLHAFANLLSQDYEVVGMVSDGRAAVAAAAELRPDVIVMDISMPRLNGLDAARQVLQKARSTRIVFVTMNEDPAIAAEAFRIGASAYLLKQSAGAELMTAIREVLEGRSYVTSLITEDLLGALLHPAAQQTSRQLTPRQREILQLLAEGRSMKEVGSLLELAPRTVAFHKYRMMEQLGVKSSAELIQYAVKHHIV